MAWKSLHVFAYKWRTFTYILLYFSGYVLGRDNLEETMQTTDVEPGSEGNFKNCESVYLPFYTFSFPYRITSMFLIKKIPSI